MFEKIALPKNSNQLPGVFITGESVMNTNNSTNIQKNSKSSPDAYLDQEKLFEEKTGDEKSHDTVPLMLTWWIFFFILFQPHPSILIQIAIKKVHGPVAGSHI
jgi:hypothetical protein